MATIEVEVTDTVNQWRTKINQLSQDVGNTDVLSTASDNLVGAVNEHETKIGTATLETEADTITEAVNELNEIANNKPATGLVLAMIMAIGS